MNYYRPSSERGRANFGWLDSKHSFSFGHYYDPKHMGFSVLRVINDDAVSPGAGFDTHGHRDMEIISYITQGAIEHKDSMGNQFIVPAGEVQRMSAGSGITHSEYNHSRTAPLKFLQIWIQPNVRGIAPSYEQKRIEQSAQLTALVTPDGKDGSLRMHQDASLYRLQLNKGESLQLPENWRHSYVHVTQGSATLSDIHGQFELASGDGYGTDASDILIESVSEKFEALCFDLP